MLMARYLLAICSILLIVLINNVDGDASKVISKLGRNKEKTSRTSILQKEKYGGDKHRKPATYSKSLSSSSKQRKITTKAPLRRQTRTRRPPVAPTPSVPRMQRTRPTRLPTKPTHLPYPPVSQRPSAPEEKSLKKQQSHPLQSIQRTPNTTIGWIEPKQNKSPSQAGIKKCDKLAKEIHDTIRNRLKINWN